MVRADLGRVLKMPINKIRVVSTQVGGCFGGKNEMTLEPILALLAKKPGKPVKGVLTREEEFLSTTKRHPFVIDYATAVHKSGRILGRKVRLVADGGPMPPGPKRLWAKRQSFPPVRTRSKTFWRRALRFTPTRP